jgi:hypothetical protein
MLTESKRWRHFAAMVLIGDGVMGLVRPRRDAEAWAKGPRPWRTMMRYLAERPALARTIGAAQIVGAVAWALHEEKKG